MPHRHEQLTLGGLRLAFAVTAAILLAESLGGRLAHSLALLAVAGHVLTDLFALGLAWYAAHQAMRPADASRTYGYRRLGILVALANAVVLIVIAVLIAFEAYRRFFEVNPVNSGLMLVVASFALMANAGVAWQLSQTGGGNLNVKSALLHVVGDAGAAAGVLAAGVAIAFTQFYQLDPIASVVVAVLICLGAWRIIGQALGILMEAAPAGLNMAEVVRTMLRVRGVKDVHDLHVWSISDEMVALSCHIVMEDQRTSEAAAVLSALKHRLHDQFGVEHATIEVECEGCETESAFCEADSHEELDPQHHPWRAIVSSRSS
jgi:cobalt-zinc-cadmium efflux system protein